MTRSDDAVAFRIDLPVGGDAEVRDFDLVEALDQPYRATVEIELDRGDVSPGDLPWASA